jgi:hypothetical protein|tara:strand:- start:330 stop:476 length:147 start_codon:yes stop_codon:yes gene_type:complete
MSNPILEYIEAVNKIYATNPPEIAGEMVKIMTEVAMPKTMFKQEEEDE